MVRPKEGTSEERRATDIRPAFIGVPWRRLYISVSSKSPHRLGGYFIQLSEGFDATVKGPKSHTRRHDDVGKVIVSFAASLFLLSR